MLVYNCLLSLTIPILLHGLHQNHDNSRFPIYIYYIRIICRFSFCILSPSVGSSFFLFFLRSDAVRHCRHFVWHNLAYIYYHIIYTLFYLFCIVFFSCALISNAIYNNVDDNTNIYIYSMNNNKWNNSIMENLFSVPLFVYGICFW